MQATYTLEKCKYVLLDMGDIGYRTGPSPDSDDEFIDRWDSIRKTIAQRQFEFVGYKLDQEFGEDMGTEETNVEGMLNNLGVSGNGILVKTLPGQGIAAYTALARDLVESGCSGSSSTVNQARQYGTDDAVLVLQF